MIILITASLSSKMYNRASHWKELALVATWPRFDNCSTFWLPFFVNLVLWSCKLFPSAPLVDDFSLFDECNTSITTSHKSRAGIPSTRKPASTETISDFVELWDTDVCFLHIQLVGTNVRLPKMQKILHEVDLNLRGLQQSLSPGMDPIDNVVLYYHMTILPVVICVMNKGNQTNKASVTSSCPFGDYSSKIVYRPKNVRSTNSCQKKSMSRKFWEHTLGNSPTASNSSFLKLWSSKQGVETLRNCSVFLFASSLYLSTHFFTCPSISQDHASVFAWGCSHPGSFSFAAAEIRGSQHFSVSTDNILVRFAFTLSASQVYVVKKWC